MPLPDMLSTLSRMAMEALIPGVLLGIAAVIMIAIILNRTGPLNAATRSAVWTATLAALPLMPLLYMAGQMKPAAPVAHTAPVTFTSPVRTTSSPEIATRPAVTTEYAHPLHLPVQRDMPSALLAIYAGVVVLLLLRLLAGYFSLRRLRARTRPAPADVEARLGEWLRRCPTGRNVTLRLSDQVGSPAAIGFLHPMIVMPAALVLEMSGEEFDDLGVHELAHIRRYDDWTGLAQRIVHAFLFFHPAVYWVCTKLKFEREVACDDWVVASNGSKSYAQCLTKVVELRGWHRGAMLASGAFFGRRQIVRRVELLLDKTRNAATGISMFNVIAIVLVLAGATLQIAKLPAVVAITQDDGGMRTKSRWSDSERDLRVDAAGDVQFSPDERSIAALPPWGRFDIEETRGGTRRRLEVRPSASGAPEEKYFVDGWQRPIDEAARSWAGATYPFFLRELGIDVGPRVQRILKAGGSSAVLHEVSLTQSDRSKRLYLTELIESAALAPDELRQVAISAKRMSNNNEKAEFLISNARRYAADALRPSYFHAVDSISSDNERRRVLVAMLEFDGQSADTANLVGRSAKSMSSDNEKAEVLMAIPAGSAASGCSLLKAAQTIQSDNEKARVLQRWDVAGLDQCREAYFAVVNAINADNEKASVLRGLLTRGHLNAAGYEGIANAAKRLNSNSDKANVLTVLSQYFTEAPFFEALNTVNGDNDRKSVLKAMIDSNSSKAALLQAVESASSMGSENDKAEILLAIAKASADKEVRTAVQRVCGKLASDSEYRRVASALFISPVESR